MGGTGQIKYCSCVKVALALIQKYCVGIFDDIGAEVI